MFNKILVAILLKAIQAAMCQLFEVCEADENCPDGVCDEVIRQIDAIDESAPTVAAEPQVGLMKFDPDWSKFQALAAAATAFIVALRDFLQLGPKVG